ncbi:MAG TPA: hypothetical protein GX512_03790 [Firmicutes bacterium]|nr:hypothetical protein [Candidatus Fermentithermobacillaceae bacterium]
MAFTVADIKSNIWSYMDEAPKDSDLLTSVNEALLKLGDRALVYAETEQVAEANAWYDLPAGLIGVEAVATSDGSDYRNWRARGGKISFMHSGTYKIVHTVLPARVTSISDTVQVHEAYQPAIIHYAAGWLKMQDDDESTDGKRLLAQAEVEFEQISRMLRRGRRSPNLTVKVER